MTAEEVGLAMRGQAFITCGECGRAAEVERWTVSRLGLDLPRGVYQCPHCRAAFRREAALDDLGRHVVRCVAIGGVL